MPSLQLQPGLPPLLCIHSVLHSSHFNYFRYLRGPLSHIFSCLEPSSHPHSPSSPHLQFCFLLLVVSTHFSDSLKPSWLSRRYHDTEIVHIYNITNSWWNMATSLSFSQVSRIPSLCLVDHELARSAT